MGACRAVAAAVVCAGRLPFEGKDKPEIKRNITANNLAGFPSFLTPQVSLGWCMLDDAAVQLRAVHPWQPQCLLGNSNAPALTPLSGLLACSASP